MTSLIKIVADNFKLKKEKVIEVGLENFLDKELRLASSEIIRFETKYGVKSPKELERKIKNGEVEEHPAWEDLIYWENLEKRIREINKWLKRKFTGA